QNVEITPVPGKNFRPGDELVKLDIIDDYTVKFTFAQPHPAFVLVNLAHRDGFGDNATFVPSHYLKQFHIKYNPDAGKLAEAAGFDFWYQLYGRENTRSQSIDRPSLNSFVAVRDTPQMGFMERNP